MEPISSVAYFWPYDSIDEIFRDRVQPEFGLVPSLWRMPLETWDFYYAANPNLLPSDYAAPQCQPDGWKRMTVPSAWQCEGYGFPSRLLYNDRNPDDSRDFRRLGKKKIPRYNGYNSDDETGVYRTWIQLSEAYLDRAVYFLCSGIRGAFSFYVNGARVTDSKPVYSATKIYLSPYLKTGTNLITIRISRSDAKGRGNAGEEWGSFGLSGIFRCPEIVAESLVEMDGVQIASSLIPTADLPSDLLEAESEATDAQAKEQTSLRKSKETTLNIRKKNALSSSVYASSDAKIRISLSLKNHLPYPMRIRIRTELYAVLPEYDPYHLPLQNLSCDDLEVDFAANEEKEVSILAETSSVLSWTHETPYLYDMIFTMTDSRNRIICVKKKRFGFTSVRVDDDCLFVQNQKMKIQGTRYYSFDPVTGIAISTERLRQDVIMMKRAGLNTVFSAGFSPDPFLYLLCDHYGLNLVPQSRVSQFVSMWRSVMSHPSVLMWSFSPVVFDETKAWAIKQRYSLLDARPYYMDQDREKTLSDFAPLPNRAGNIYGLWSDIALDLTALKEKNRDWVLPEKGHQTNMIRDILEKDYRFIHQADLEEVTEAKEALVMQGIVGPGREIYPAFQNVKKQCEPLLIFTAEEDPSQIAAKSLLLFQDLNNLVFSWQLLLDGMPLQRGEAEIVWIGAGEAKTLSLAFDRNVFSVPGWMEKNTRWQQIYNRALKKELILDIHVYHKDSNHYLPPNFPIAFFQQIIMDTVASSAEGRELAVLPQKESSLAVAIESQKDIPVKVVTLPELLLVGKGPVQIGFSRKSGGLSALSILQKNFLFGSLQPSFFRAAANIDRADSSFLMASTVFSQESDWREVQQQLQYKSFHYEMVGEDFSMLVQYKNSAFKGDVVLKYVMKKSGSLEVTLACTPKSPLLRMGVRVRISRDIGKIFWYGRGPGESYPDRKDCMPIGFFEGSPEEMYQPYTRPQENGTRCDVQYMILLDQENHGMKIRSKDPEGFMFSAALYPPEMLDDSPHPELLQEADYYELFLDFYQRGVERTGKETQEFVKNQVYKGTFYLDPVDMSE